MCDTLDEQLKSSLEKIEPLERVSHFVGNLLMALLLLVTIYFTFIS